MSAPTASAGDRVFSHRMTAQLGQREDHRQGHADEKWQERPRLRDLEHHGEVGPGLPPHRRGIDQAHDGHGDHEVVARALHGFTPAQGQPGYADAHHQMQAAVIGDRAADEGQAGQRILGHLVGPDQRGVEQAAQCRVAEQQQQFEEKHQGQQHVERSLDAGREALMRKADIYGHLNADRVVLRGRSGKLHSFVLRCEACAKTSPRPGAGAEMYELVSVQASRVTLMPDAAAIWPMAEPGLMPCLSAMKSSQSSTCLPVRFRDPRTGLAWSVATSTVVGCKLALRAVFMLQCSRHGQLQIAMSMAPKYPFRTM